MTITVVHDELRSLQARRFCECLETRGVEGVKPFSIGIEVDCLTAFASAFNSEPRPTVTVVFLTDRFEEPSVLQDVLQRVSNVPHALVVSSASWSAAAASDPRHRLFFGSLVISDGEYLELKTPPKDYFHLGGKVVHLENGHQAIYTKSVIDSVAAMLKTAVANAPPTPNLPSDDLEETLHKPDMVPDGGIEQLAVTLRRPRVIELARSVALKHMGRHS